MNTLKTTLAIAALALASITVVPNQASACGVIGCVLNEISPGLGDAADDWNDRNGNIFDHTLAAAAEAVAPGVGTTMEAYWAAQRAGTFDNFQGGGAPGGSWPQQKQSQPMGNVCLTQVGRSQPGPYMPVGSSCYSWDQYGRQVWGTVGQ